MGNLTQKSSKFATLSDTTGWYQTTDVSEHRHLAFFCLNDNFLTHTLLDGLFKHSTNTITSLHVQLGA